MQVIKDQEDTSFKKNRIKVFFHTFYRLGVQAMFNERKEKKYIFTRYLKAPLWGTSRITSALTTGVLMRLEETYSMLRG